jgi:hypothetical protein
MTRNANDHSTWRKERRGRILGGRKPTPLDYLKYRSPYLSATQVKLEREQSLGKVLTPQATKA